MSPVTFNVNKKGRVAMLNRCPNCHKDRVSRQGRKPTLLFILLWPWTLLFMTPQFRCRDCGAKWKA